MRTTIRGKNLTIAEADREYVERKMQRLERMLDDRSETEVELRLEKRSNEANSHVVEVTLNIDGQPLRGSASASTFRAATDDVIDKLERRTVEYKQRPRDRARASNALRDGSTAALPEDGDEVGKPLIVKVKRFAIEPMFEEDALSRMEELGHTFFIFVNAESERVAVLYRRNDGRYGLIEPAIGGSYSSAD
jgi:putative sigma-54 modulation protein